MFENVGEKLKAIAITIFVIDIVAAAVSGIIAWVNVGALGFFLFLLILAGGLFIAWISALVPYAIGEAADKSEINSKLDKIMQSLQNNQMPSNTSAPAKASTTAAMTPAINTVSVVPKKVRDADSESMKQVCPKCGEKNDIARVFCHKCGARLS